MIRNQFRHSIYQEFPSILPRRKSEECGKLQNLDWMKILRYIEILKFLLFGFFSRPPLLTIYVIITRIIRLLIRFNYQIIIRIRFEKGKERNDRRWEVILLHVFEAKQPTRANDRNASSAHVASKFDESSHLCAPDVYHYPSWTHYHCPLATIQTEWIRFTNELYIVFNRRRRRLQPFQPIPLNNHMYAGSLSPLERGKKEGGKKKRRSGIEQRETT